MHILRYPDPLLRRQCEPVKEISTFLDEMAACMAELMQAERGIGLAAPQVGWRFRMAVLNPALEPGKFEAVINPAIIKREGKVLEEEGCLSVPGVFANVRRAERVRVRATRLNGETVEFDAEGLAARLWQHELDHFDGTLFVDRLSTGSKILVQGALRDLEQRGAGENAPAGESDGVQ